MQMRSVLAVLVVGAALAAFGCNGNDDDGGGGSGGTGGTGGTGGSGGTGGGGGTGGEGGTGGGGGTGGSGGAMTYEIVIENLTFSPENLTVPAGATITVTNRDTTPHSVTSQSAPEQYTPGAVDGISFDTGAFPAGERTITIPETATSGTVIPYFCTVHVDAMANDGQITIQ